MSGSYFGDLAGSSVLIENVNTSTTHKFSGAIIVASCAGCNINITNATTEVGGAESIAIGSASGSRVYYSNFSLKTNSRIEGTISAGPSAFKVDGWFNSTGTQPGCTMAADECEWLENNGWCNICQK